MTDTIKKLNKKLPIKIGVGYIRESTEEQDTGYSPQNQERKIREYAEQHNIQITEIYKDLISGKEADKRDNFQRMVSDAMQHKFEVILIFHTSRFARNVKEARHYKELLRKKLNIDVTSVTQNFGDWQDPSAFLNEGVNELFDEHYSRQLSFWVKGALIEKRQQGYQNGNPPFGYYKKQIGYDKEKNRKIYEKEWRVNTEEAQIVKKIYKLYATGKYSIIDIAEKFKNEGIKTKYGNPFTYSSTKDILSNRVYLGYVSSKRKKDLPDLQGKHPAIISKSLFDKVQDKIAERRITIGRPVAQHRFYLLQGLVYCYDCLKHLKGKENNPYAKLIPKMFCMTSWWKDKDNQKREAYSYACKLKREMKSCNQPNVTCGIIDQQAIQLMNGFNAPINIIKITLEKLSKMLDEASHSKQEQEEVKKLETKKKRLNFQFTNTEELEEQDYLKQVKEINEQLAFYKKIGLTSNKKPAKKEIITKTEKYLKNFRKFWNEETDNKEKRDWFLMTIKRLWVKKQKLVAVEPQDDFKPLFASFKKVSGQLPIVT